MKEGHAGYAGESPWQPNRPGLHPDSLQSLESVSDFRHPPDYYDHRQNLGTDYHDMPRNQHHNIAQRQTNKGVLKVVKYLRSVKNYIILVFFVQLGLNMVLMTVVSKKKIRVEKSKNH